MRLVFIGASHFGLRCLDAVLQLPGIQVVGVVTAPATFHISYRPSGVTNVLHADISSFTTARSLPTMILRDGMKDPALLDAVRSWQPDAFLISGWYHMVPRSWRELAPAYGLHASLLPDYSGGAPLVWAIINGEERTGITLFKMDDGVDSGPIAAQASEPILADDTIATLYARIEERGLELIRRALPQVANGSIELKAQDESRRRVFRQRGPEDGLIVWSQNAAGIDRFIRAQTRPYPGAFSVLDGRMLTIWRADVDMASHNLAPGTIHGYRRGYAVACGHGRILLREVACGGKDLDPVDLSELFGSVERRFDNCRNLFLPCGIRDCRA